MRVGSLVTGLNTMRHAIGAFHGAQTIQLPIAGWTWDMMRADGTLTGLDSMKHATGTMHGMQYILPIAGWT